MTNYSTDYIRERVRDIRAVQPEEPYGVLEMAVMAAISYTAVKLRYNALATAWGDKHPDQYARAYETDSLLNTDDMIHLYSTMMSWGSIGDDINHPHEDLPIPKTRDVHRYLSVINRVENPN